MRLDLDEAAVSPQVRASSGPWLVWVAPAGVVAAFVGILASMAQHEAVVHTVGGGISGNGRFVVFNTICACGQDTVGDV